MSLEIQPYPDILEIPCQLNTTSLLIHGLGGLFPGLPREQISHTNKIIEVECGPGAWLLECAQTYRNIQVVGIDTRETMIGYARNRIKAQHVSNACALLVPSLAAPLPFADASYDLVCAQLMSTFLQAQEWPYFLAECHRVLRKGGLLRLTEGEFAFTNAPAHQTCNQRYHQAMQAQGRNPFLSVYPIGWSCELEPRLVATGFQECLCVPHVVNYSYGTPLYKAWKRELSLHVRRQLPLLIEMSVITHQEGHLLQYRLHQEMNLPTFHALQYFLTVWARKP